VSDTVGKYLDGDALALALTSGIHRVIAEQELLNRINVFPVADSDTGTNLSLSLGSALGLLGNPGERHLGILLAALADTLLDSARGNSGAIMAQFFQGMSDSAGEITRFTTYTFAKAVALGNEYAHDALSKPREGTILSVIAAFAESVTHQVRSAREEDFPTAIRQAMQRVDEALSNTPNQLDVLRKAGVVDAGAKGFAELVSGMERYLSNGTIEPLPDKSIAHHDEPAIEFAEADNESRFRYCTECLVTGEDINRRKLREALSELGDSVVLAGTKRKAKIHVHVDDPDAVFEVAGRFGELSATKADDMHRQQHSTQENHRRFAVITDSVADIPEDDIERLDIHLVPARIQFGNHGYLDKVSITIEEVYQKILAGEPYPTTSQPSPGDFRRQFQFLASHYDDVISINLTSAGSGTYQAAELAASRIKASGTVHVVDSRNASLGQGQLVILAAECAYAGLDAARTLLAIGKRIPMTRSFALLSDLRFPVRGGRLPAWVKVLADLLRMTPIICTKSDGQISLSGFLFGKRNLISRFARHVARRAPKAAVDIGIGHAVNPDGARELELAARRYFDNIGKLTVTALGPGLGVHGGPGTLLIATGPYWSAQDVARGID
jgi:DegV family protein with EDD domain